MYHQRSPTPNHGSVLQTVIESWNQVSRCKHGVELVVGLQLVLDEVGHERHEDRRQQQHELGALAIRVGAEDEHEDSADEADDGLP